MKTEDRLRVILAKLYYQHNSKFSVKESRHLISQALTAILKEFEGLEKENNGLKRYRDMIDEAYKYREKHRDYEDKCNNIQTLRILLGCQTIEIGELRIEAENKIKTLKQEIEGLEEFKQQYFSDVEGVRYSQVIALEKENVRLQQENEQLKQRELDVGKVERIVSQKEFHDGYKYDNADGSVDRKLSTTIATAFKKVKIG